MRQDGRLVSSGRSKARFDAQRGELAAAGWLVGVSVIAWLLANVLDVSSAVAMVQSGEQLAWARGHPSEGILIYALLRVLLALAVPLCAASVGRRWPWMARGAWAALSLCTLVTAAAAWWRLRL
jgi:hypothetical protein